MKNRIKQFVDICKTLTSDQIYVLFEELIDKDLQAALYACGRGDAVNEPCRDAMITLGKKYNIQSLIDY
jgi:hypothetical protein